ncbi:PEP-CTERM sorting domain-containing protein [Akkermansiaceae bacterium]|nr:PEP-CTERM sorting domain-containing protein [Akkermansiaceae bacterium]
MKNPTRLALLAILLGAPAAHSAIIVNLLPGDAKRAGGATAGVTPSGIVQADGMAFNITFTPTAADLTGLVTLMEIGGQTSGTALYLLDGTPIFLSKSGGGNVYTPTDTSFGDGSGIAILHSGGVLTAGVQTVAALVYSGAGGAYSFGVGLSPIVDSGTVTSPQANWNGNNSLSVGTRSVNNGDRAGTFSSAGAFNQDLKSLAGTIDGDAYFWNNGTASIVPEPSTALLGALGMLALLRRRRA